MEGKIDREGYLHLKRKNKVQHQICPHSHTSDEWCGDWCPLFSEPEFRKQTEYEGEFKDARWVIFLCSSTLELTDFKDERGLHAKNKSRTTKKRKSSRS